MVCDSLKLPYFTFQNKAEFTCTFCSGLNKSQITMFFFWKTKEELPAYMIKLLISVFFLGGKKKTQRIHFIVDCYQFMNSSALILI